jgi:hypothetical protein
MFHFPATAALFLRSRTYMSDVCIANTIRNRMADREEFWIKSTRPGNHHYRVTPTDGGFRILVTRMGNTFAGA